MECLGQVFSIVPCLWECSLKHSAYITSLEGNLNSLRSAMDELNNLSQDVKNRVEEAEEQRMKRKHQVSGWLQRVEDMDKEVNQILQKGTQEIENKCLGGCCPKNCRSSYKLGKKVTKMIPEVTGLTEKGKFDVVADQLPPPSVDELPMENAVVGFESKFQEVWHVVQDNDSTVIGMVGIGGVGKTTLLKQLNNEFSKATHEYDLVIWVVVSKPASLGRIQDTIRNKLNITDHLWADKSEAERAILIHNILKKKKFVILLDDIWEALELSELGIPRPGRDGMSKVVLTTRSRYVCQSMDAHRSIEVGCLPPDEAFTLFISKVGEDVLNSHPEIHELVKDVASECQGLPLALITIGRTMRGKTDAQQWKDAKMALEKYPSTFSSMEDLVFGRLQFSYDNLPTPTLQKCFEYCSLYPEDYNISKDEIIKLWIAEGLIDEYDNMGHALLQGRQVIENLMQASLLETGLEEGTMKMHDVIRDMALWIACEHGHKKKKFWVINVASGDHDAISPAPNAMRKWSSNVEKISVWGGGTTNVRSLVELSFCSNLVTLIIRGTYLKKLHELLQSAKVLKVLNLSENMIPGPGELPTEIGDLSELEYLNLKGTGLERLPMEFQKLKKLRFLVLDDLTVIPEEIISSLSSLHTFEQYTTRLDFISGKNLRKSMERHVLQELEGLKQIMDLRLILKSTEGIQILLNSSKLQSCTSQLLLKPAWALPDDLDLATAGLAKNLELLDVRYCVTSAVKLGRPFLSNNLHKVLFSNCNNVRNLSSLVYVPNLCVLEVWNCESMEELIGEDAEEISISLFSCLTHLSLEGLSKLKSICPQSSLPFPSLKLMSIRKCESLGKLPLDSNSALTTPSEFKIQGKMEWWDGLQWDGQATKDAFTPYFVEFQY